MAICLNCGHYVHEGITRCDVCGTLVSQAPVGAPPPIPTIAQPSVEVVVKQPGVEVVQQSGVEVAVQQPAPPPVNPPMPDLPPSIPTQRVKQAVESVAAGAIPNIPSIPSIPSTPSIPSIPSIPSVESIGSMATGGVTQAATQAVQQFVNGIDLKMTDAPGIIVGQRWTQLMSPAGGAVGAVASQAKKWTREKLSWLWFLIPIITIIIYLINLATK